MSRGPRRGSRPVDDDMTPDPPVDPELGLDPSLDAPAPHSLAGDGGLPPDGVYDRVLREIERPLIGKALAVTRGNQLRAADLLGMNRNTLRKKIRELDIVVSRAP